MYREHVLVYRTDDAGKLVWHFTAKQAGWLGLGLYLTMSLLSSFPGIPGIGIWGYVFHTIPFILGALFAFGKHNKTGTSLWVYLVSWVSCRRRKRVFTYFQ